MIFCEKNLVHSKGVWRVKVSSPTGVVCVGESLVSIAPRCWCVDPKDRSGASCLRVGGKSF